MGGILILYHEYIIDTALLLYSAAVDRIQWAWLAILLKQMYFSQANTVWNQGIRNEQTHEDLLR